MKLSAYFVAPHLSFLCVCKKVNILVEGGTQADIRGVWPSGYGKGSEYVWMLVCCWGCVWGRNGLWSIIASGGKL